MDMKKLKCGDIVQKKGQNYNMTVREHTDNGIVCDWFIGTQNYQDTFSEEELTLISLSENSG
jgi:uncharacterized protein YodC (DUF2158 family)